jgi:hypothetical protein
MQLILCVESLSKGNKGGSDRNYILATMRRFYPEDLGREKITWVYLGGKSNYDRQEKKINAYIAHYGESITTDGIPHVIFFVDTDLGGPGSDAENKAIQAYCAQRGYDVVWFNRDIEEVYLRKRLASTPEKTKEATSFFLKKRIEMVDKKALCSPSPARSFGQSNILCVLGEYLHR